MFQSLFKKKGFALTQVLLALAIGSVVAAGIVTYYSHLQKDQNNKLVADNILNNTEISFQESQINGSLTNQQITVNGSNVSILAGKATVTQMSNDRCNSLSSNLKQKGVVTATCTGDVATNVVTFIPKNFAASSKSNLGFVAGTADPGATNTVNAPNLTGIFVAGGTGVAAGSTKTFTPITPGTPITNPGVIDGNNGALGAGGSSNPSVGSAPVSVTGSTSLACGYYLTQPAYQTTSLGTRTTSCPSGYISTANQNGTRTWACASPTSANRPVSTDTWTGGACTALCVPAASQTQTLGCPSGQTGAIAQQRNSTCPAQTGNPVFGNWYTTSNTCVTPAAPATNWASLYSVSLALGGDIDINGHNDPEFFGVDLNVGIYVPGLQNYQEELNLAPAGGVNGCLDLLAPDETSAEDAKAIPVCAQIQSELIRYFTNPTVAFNGIYVDVTCSPQNPTTCGPVLDYNSIIFSPNGFNVNSGIGGGIVIYNAQGKRLQ